MLCSLFEATGKSIVLKYKNCTGLYEKKNQQQLSAKGSVSKNTLRIKESRYRRGYCLQSNVRSYLASSYPGTIPATQQCWSIICHILTPSKQSQHRPPSNICTPIPTKVNSTHITARQPLVPSSGGIQIF